MPGYPRDLAVVDHWSASLERSLARRGRTDRRAIAPWRPPERVAVRRCWTPVERCACRATSPTRSPGSCRSGARARAGARRSCASCPAARAPNASRSARSRRSRSARRRASPAARRRAPPATSPGPTTTTEHVIVLSSGSEGRQVQLLQQALGAIKVDGVFGPETEAAVRSFQASRGLTVDGVVGR